MSTSSHPHTPPIETERDAAALVQHVLDSPPEAQTNGNHSVLEEACRIADITLGAFDYQVLLALANLEPTTVAVVASLLRRAHETRPATQYGEFASGVAMPGGGWISGPST